MVVFIIFYHLIIQKDLKEMIRHCSFSLLAPCGLGGLIAVQSGLEDLITICKL
jgi:hypothetical protein